ncbi:MULTISPECIES: hypothetical protein [Acidiphilium]|uniref:DUF5666 domain-containing protein n=1 Tax=Acidiphilium rubrum TaxID=526 RepID=A0A8G2CLI4_ACIRU|nr:MULTISPECIES: hypothetical protein [Acidiphilium]SIR01523.1 hypothetical protein SAMN05421828_11397 [Acidiphilium rubrum]
MTRIKSLLLAGAAAGLLGAGFASAATTPTGADALPSYTGTVKHFTITPRGAIDGVILSNGTDVMFPPYLSTQIAYAVKQGDSVTIHGLKAAKEPVVQGVSITDGSHTVTDNGPPAGFGPHHHGAPTRMMVQGKVAQYLYGPRGEKNGVLLDDGTALHMPPPAIAKASVANLLKPGDKIAAVGFGTTNALGSVVMVQQIGADFKDLTRIAMPRPPHGPGMGPGPGWHHGPHGGPGMRHAMMRPMGGPDGGPGAPPPPPPADAGATSK